MQQDIKKRFLEKWPNNVQYRYWLDRVTSFYIAARILLNFECQSPATCHVSGPGAFCAYQAVENILKAALYYQGQMCKALECKHCLQNLSEALSNNKKHKVIVSVPKYFDDYQSIPRYPESITGQVGSGLKIEATIVDDLDRIVFDVISQIPDKGPNLLKNLFEHEPADVPEIFQNNQYFYRLKAYYWGK